MCQRSVYIKCLTCYLVLLVGSHRAESAHIVQTVGHLQQHHAYVFAHGKQEFPEILGLRRSLVAEDTSRYFGEARHELRYFLAEILLYVLHGVFRVLHHIMQQRGTDRRGSKTYLLTGNLCHSDRMQYIWFS